MLHDYDMSLESPPSSDEVIRAIGDPTVYEEIVFCGYGEPTLRLKQLLSVAKWVKSNAGKVRVNTDGLGSLTNKRNILPELSECVDALSISLNAQDEATYNRHCHPGINGSWAAMLAFTKEAPRWINDVSVSAINGLPGVDITECKKLAASLGVTFRERHLDLVG
jgi:TatD family-associated radical SAM protein